MKHALSDFDELDIRNSAQAALGELAMYDNAEGKIEAAKALREAVKTALANQAKIAGALGRLKIYLDEQER